MSALLDSLQESFAALPAGRVDAAGLGATRRTAMLQTVAEGLPGQRSERWKYTALRALSARTFAAAGIATPVPSSLLSDIPGPRMVFVNGRLDQGLSLLAELPDGLRVDSLSAMLDASDPGSVQFLAQRFDRPDEAFARLNAALAVDGAVVRVAGGQAVATPLHLVFVGAPAEADIASHCRHWISLAPGARLTVVEHLIGAGAHRNLDNQLLQVDLAADATLLHARLQDEDTTATLLSRTDASLGANALYHRLDLELGAALSRHELNVGLLGGNAQFRSSGALLAGGRRHVDTRLEVRHHGRDTRCDLMWRGLAADRGRLAFHGGIEILAGADGSDARLSNKNLLLSADAEIDTQPVLQIHADEVKAAHGATVGRLDATALFYLRSRGVPAAQARVLLTLAFCREALAAIGDAALVDLLSPRLEARLAGLESVT